MTMKLDNTSLLARILRRFGRFAIAILSLLAFALGFGAAYLATALTMGFWSPKGCLAAGFIAATAVYSICDRLDIIPEDPDKLMTLNLSQSSMPAEPWVSSDFEKK
jgi:hypothetical protein